MPRALNGLTAIEVAIVLTVAGFVAAFALPWYQNYSVREKVAAIMAASASARSTVEDHVVAHGELPATGAVVLPFITEKHVALSEWAGSGAVGTVTVSLRPTPNRDERALDAKAIVWTASYNRAARSVDWRCGGTPATTVDERYLPAECR